MQKSSLEMMQCFLDLGFAVDVSTNGTATPLWYAAQRDGSDEVVKFLIERGANVNAGAGEWATVLHCAANANRPRAVRLLLEHGADPGFEDVEGETPLALATRRKFEEVIAVLQEFEAPMVG
ncbi:MAG TPA: ankyrin repeat domain-containing protein, partial [Verrucomicrobiae bacterium]|nr:ankyrin repeat domain-containing protein [Verrucomicrobiae bacterium]